MSEMRVALYVDKSTKVTIAPVGPIDLYQMDAKYGATFMAAIASEQSIALEPGVYGFAYLDRHGIDAGPEVRLVVDSQRKQPWPSPPPPPPPPFLGRRDWGDHLKVFLAPLGFEAADAADAADAASSAG